MSCGQLALQRAGLDVDIYMASEIDKYGKQVTRKNFPNTIQLGDVCDVKGENLPPIDLLLAGSPCQDVSFAGKGKGLIKGERSSLFFQFVRILKETNPKYFLLENVRMKKEYQDIISEHLGVKPVMINSSLVSAQNRVRFYWTNIPGLIQPKDKGIKLKHILEDDVTEPMLSNIYGGFKEKKPRIHTGKSVTIRTASGGGHIPSITLKIKEATKKGYRKLTPTECERLQTVPDGYTKGVSNTRRYQLLGNGMTIDVIVHLLQGIKAEFIKQRIAA
jgi:site-specific DNA-cytosine methylase